MAAKIAVAPTASASDVARTIDAAEQPDPSGRSPVTPTIYLEPDVERGDEREDSGMERVVESVDTSSEPPTRRP